MKTKKLNEIAVITNGIGYRTEDLTTTEEGYPFLTIANIKNDYNLSEPDKFINLSSDKDLYKLKINDILVSKVGANIKFAFIEKEPFKPSYFSHNLIRVRLRVEETFSARELLKYLSITVLDEIKSYQKGTVLPHITVEDLGNIEVHIDEDEIIDSSQLKHVILALDDQISKLRNLSDLNEASPVFEKISEIVKVPNINEEILTTFPYPLAHRFGQYLDSTHDNYQRLTRLRDVFESITYFLYSIYLKDYFLNLDKNNIALDASQRTAYNGYSIAHRLTFIKKLIEKFGDKLFINFIDLTTIQALAASQEEFRNKISHTATFSAKQAEELHDEYFQLLQKVLNGIAAIKDYNLVRIKSWSFKDGNKSVLTETYRGLKPRIGYESFETEIKENSEHILLLDTSDDSLPYINLHPFYQIISNTDTKNQEFMAFMKRRKASEHKLIGECIPWTFELKIEGFDYLDNYLDNKS